MTNPTREENAKSLRIEIKDKCAVVGSSWTIITGVAVKVFKHCLEYDDLSLSSTMHHHLLNANHPELLRAFKYAAFDILAGKYTVDPETNRSNGTRNPKQWKQIEAEESAANMMKLVESGLRAFLPDATKKPKAKPDAALAALDIQLKNIHEAIGFFKKSDNEKVKEYANEFTHRFNDLYNEMISMCRDVDLNLAADLMKRDVSYVIKAAKAQETANANDETPASVAASCDGDQLAEAS